MIRGTLLRLGLARIGLVEIVVRYARFCRRQDSLVSFSKKKQPDPRPNSEPIQYATQTTNYFWLPAGEVTIHAAISVITKPPTVSSVDCVQHTHCQLRAILIIPCQKNCDIIFFFLFVKTKTSIVTMTKTSSKMARTSSPITTVRLKHKDTEDSSINTIAIAVPVSLLAVILVVTLIYFVCYRRQKRYVCFQFAIVKRMSLFTLKFYHRLPYMALHTLCQWLHALVMHYFFVFRLV